MDNKAKEEPTPPEQPKSKVVHTLDDSVEEVDAVGNIHTKEEELYNTPQAARDMEVTAEEINPEDFIINDTSEETKNVEVNEPEEVQDENDDQFMFTFDFPINQEEEENKPKERTEKPRQEVRHQLEDDKSKNIEVNEPVEVNTGETRGSTQAEKRYSLDDYMEVEQSLESSKPKKRKNLRMRP